MTTLREAATMALEALEEWHGAYPHRVEEDDIEVAEALRAALAEPDYWEEEARRYASNADYWRKRCVSCGGALPATGQDDRTGECVCGEPTALNTVHRTDGPCYVAEPVQEPVVNQQLTTEPVGIVTKLVKGGVTWNRWPSDMPDGTKLYVAPPQRKPLTEEEIKACEKQAMVNGALPFEQRVFFARALERAHGIK